MNRFGAVTTTEGQGREVSAASIVADMRRLMPEMPPAEVFVSWSMAPRDAAWRITGEQENFTVAHADFWRAAAPLMRAEEARADNPLFLMRVLDADVDRDLKLRVVAAMKRAFEPPVDGSKAAAKSPIR